MSELYHHGIKGQKWGVRRFQNEDGTLTTAGKKRYGESSDYKTTKTLMSKSIPELSNDDLKTVSTRKELEQRYQKATDKQVLKKVAGGIAATAAVLGAIGLLYKNGGEVIQAGKEVWEKGRAIASNVRMSDIAWVI